MKLDSHRVSRLAGLVLAGFCLQFAGLANSPLRAQENAGNAPGGDLVAAAYRILQERGLEPLTKVTSFYTLAVLNGKAEKAFTMIETSDAIQAE